MPEVRIINPTKANEKARIRVAAYCRVSSDSDEQLESYAAQVNHYTARIAEQPDWELADIYADEAVTGTRNDTREEFQRMLTDCRKGRIDRILVKSISRFSRNTQDSLQAVRELSSLGVEIVFEKENISTVGMSSEFMLGTYSSFAQKESESISGNMRWSYKRRMERGEVITTSPAFGYDFRNNTLYVNAAESEVVKRIFRDYLQGKGVTEIARELSLEQIPRKEGSASWGHNTIAYILSNEKYIGDAVMQKSYMTDSLPFTKKPNRGERDRYYLHNSHEPIISREDFAQAQALIANRNFPKSGRERYPFTKKIICGHCGSVFRRKHNSGGKIYWVCRNHYADTGACPIKQIPEPEFEAAFTRMAEKLRKNSRYILSPMLAQLEELKSKLTCSNKRVGEINLAIAELGEQNLVLARLRSKGYLDSVLFMERSNEIVRKIDALKSEKRRLTSRDEDDRIIAEAGRLITMLESSARSDCFDADLFEQTVDKIIAESQTSVRVRLKCGLELHETIKEAAR